MEVKICKREHVLSTIEVEFPYYFESDYSDDYEDSWLYGKMEKNSHIIIHVTHKRDEVEEISIIRTTHNLSQDYDLCKYFEDQFKSTKENYDRGLKQSKVFLDDIII
jgi:hypothetical protein